MRILDDKLRRKLTDLNWDLDEIESLEDDAIVIDGDENCLEIEKEGERYKIDPSGEKTNN